MIRVRKFAVAALRSGGQLWTRVPELCPSRDLRAPPSGVLVGIETGDHGDAPILCALEELLWNFIKESRRRIV